MCVLYCLLAKGPMRLAQMGVKVIRTIGLGGSPLAPDSLHVEQFAQLVCPSAPASLGIVHLMQALAIFMLDAAFVVQKKKTGKKEQDERHVFQAGSPDWVLRLIVIIIVRARARG